MFTPDIPCAADGYPRVLRYLTEMDPNKRMVLMLNKSDLLTDKMRLDWGAYLESKGIEFAFFSAL